MTDSNYTALLLVIDRSGSMLDIRDDMVGGLETMLRQQAAEPGMLTVDVVTFDDEVEWQHSFADPSTVRVELIPRGSTALFDALGGSIGHFGEKLRELPDHARPGRVQVVVVTDGEENSSREWTAAAVSAAVIRQQTEFGWDFVFLGANQDAALAAGRMGIDADSALNYAPAPDSIQATNEGLSRYVTDVRGGTRRGFSDGERTAAGGDS